MKVKKILAVSGAIFLMAGITVNVKNALDEHGLLTASLHPNVQAQVGGVNGTTTGMGFQEKTQVKCVRKTYIKKEDSSSSSNNTGSSVGAGVGVGGPGWGANVDATVTSGTTTSIGSFDEEYIEVTEDFQADKYYCGLASYVAVCSITNPCVQ